MIRKVIIVALTVAAVSVGILTPLSCAGVPLVWESSTTMSRAGFNSGQLFLEIDEVLHARQPERWQEWSFTTLGKGDFFIGIQEVFYGEAVFDWHDGTSRRQLRMNFTHFPLFLLLAAYPTIAFIRGPVRRYRRRRKGECIGCGYDLTGN